MAVSYQKVLETSFGFPFPDDFFRFQDFLQVLKERGLSLGESLLGLFPANVFQVFDEVPEPNTDLETRFWRDPPEFVTLLIGNVDGLHWGYYVDAPEHSPYPVAHYYHNDSFELEIDGDLFAAVSNYVADERQNFENLLKDDPASAEHYQAKLRQLDAFMEVLTPYLGQAPISRQVVAQTRDGMGIVVPAELYVPLLPKDPFQDALYYPSADEVRSFKELALASLQNGCPGAALKLGKDLWDYAAYFEISCELLDIAYGALGRPLLQNRLARIRQDRRQSPSVR
ncbi:MAG: DUF2228 domain-containing protein [Acidobacteria bacterium]|nr:DUF2228 domain-containing protein [Acidobacteriota bacterium]